MVQLTELKNALTTSFKEGKGFPLDLGFVTPSLESFLTSLDFSKSKLDISQPDETSLALAISNVASLSLDGILSGKLAWDGLFVTLRQRESDKLAVDLSFDGSFVRTSTRKGLKLQGVFQDAEGDAGDVLTLTLDAEGLPQLVDMAQWVGLSSFTNDLTGLGLELSTIAGASFSVDLATRKMTSMTAAGSLTLASCGLDATVTFDPDATLILQIAEGEDLTLTEAIAALGLSAADLPDIALDQFTLTAHPSAKTYITTANLANDWSVDVGGSSLALTAVGVEVTSTKGEKTFSLAGALQIGNASLMVTAARDEGDVPLTLLCDLDDGDTIELSSAIEQLVGTVAILPVDLPDFVLTEIKFSIVPQTGEYSLFAESDELWGLDIGETGLDLDDVTLQLDRKVTANGTKATTGAIAGTLDIATVECRCEYAFPGEFVLGGSLPPFKISPILQDLGGTSALKDLPVPLSVLSVQCEGGTLAIAPKSKTLSISAASKLGATELNLSRTSSGWGFVVGFAPPPSWKFSSIDSSLSVLDGLKFSETALILASNTDKSLALQSINTPDGGAAVIRGFNFFATLDMTGTGVDALLGLEALTVYSAIGGKPSDLVIEALIDGEFNLGDGVLFGDIKLRLQPAPSNFALSLLGVVSAELDNSQLRFVGGMSVTPRSALFQATMEGVWQDPFDTRNVAIANLALEFGASMPPLLPSIGLAGSLQVGEFAGAVAVKFDAAMPSRSMLAIAFNQLYLMDVIRTFCGLSVAQAIPAGLTKTVLNIGFEDVNIYIVPQPTTIGTLVFEQGFYLGGTLVFAGWRATASLSIDYLEGTELKAELDPINVAGIFKLSGARGETKPSLYLKLSPTTVPALKVSGAVELLGLKSETYIEFSDSGFYFLSQGSLFGLFNTSLEVSGTDFTNGGSYWLRATMQNDLMEYLRDNATKAIQRAAASATAELTAAQNDVKAAERKVQSLSKDIADMRATIQRERDRDSAKLKAAQADVTKVQNDVNSLMNQITSMRRQIQRERDAATRDLTNARNSVSSAQNDVNSIQREINSTKSRISQLKSDIDKKHRWFKKSKWYQKSYRWAEYSAYAAAKGSEIGALYTKIGGLETAKATANGVLEAAKQVLRGIEAGVDTFPIDADPRIAGLFTAKETANASLVVAKETVKLIEKSIQTIPIELDPRLSGLYVAKESAEVGLDAAYYFLEGVKKSVGAVAEVGTFIAEVGLGGLLDVKSATFEGSLEATSGGSVSLDLSVSFMQGQPQSLALAFNFKSPLAAAEDLAKKLLPA